MSKVKIVQVFCTVFQDDIHQEYLDDQGRVWYKAFDEGKAKYMWNQIDLPDEPNEGI